MGDGWWLSIKFKVLTAQQKHHRSPKGDSVLFQSGSAAVVALGFFFSKSWSEIFLLEMKKNSWAHVLLKHCKTIHSLYFQGTFCVQNKTVTKIKLLLCYSEEDFVRQPRIFPHYFRLSLSLTFVIIIFLLLCINRKHEPTLSRYSWDEWSHLPGLHT